MVMAYSQRQTGGPSAGVFENSPAASYTWQICSQYNCRECHVGAEAFRNQSPFKAFAYLFEQYSQSLMHLPTVSESWSVALIASSPLDDVTWSTSSRHLHAIIPSQSYALFFNRAVM